MLKPIKITHPDDLIILGCSHMDHQQPFVWSARGFDSPESHADWICKEVADWYREHPYGQMIHLGDGFLNSTPERALSYFARWGIPTQYVFGNHEGPTYQLYRAEIERIGFKIGEIYPITVANVTFLGYQATFSVGHQLIFAHHFPQAVWDKSHHGAWHIHSHNHHSYPQSHADYLELKRLDCGVDSCIKYFGKPYITFSQLKTIMDKKKVHQVDHHGSDTN